MLPLTKKESNHIKRQKLCYICGKGIQEKFAKDKNYQRVGNHCHYTGKYREAAQSICNLKFNMSNEIPVVCHRGSNCDYHFIIKELANDLKDNLNVLEKTKKSTKVFPL